MGILTNFWRRATGRDERKYTTLDLFRELYGGRESKTGKSVTLANAIEVSAVLGCARVIAEGIAQVPLKLLRTDGRTRAPAREHPLYDVLAHRPNPWQTSFELRETLALHAVLAGNFFAYKNIGVAGEVVELIPFEPRQVTVKRASNYALQYEVTSDSGAKRVFPQEVIWHVRGPSWNSWMGLEAVALAREAIGLAMATEESQATLHKQGAMSNGLYSVEGTLTTEQHKALREWVEREIQGLANAWRPLILDRNAKFTPISMNGVDAQLLETRRYQVEEICRAFRVMPIMVGYADKTATYASAEQMFLAHVVHTLAPWYQRLEQSIDANLLSERDRRDGLYAKFIEEGLLRGSLQATADFLVKLTTNGLMTRNEGRDKLDLNPLDGLDEPLTPGNMVVGAQPPPPPEPPPPDAKAEQMHAALVTALLREPAPSTVNVTGAPIHVSPPAVTVHESAAPISLHVEDKEQRELVLMMDRLATGMATLAETTTGSTAQADAAQERLARDMQRLAHLVAQPKQIVRGPDGRAIGVKIQE